MPDVLALTLDDAVHILQEEGWKYQVNHTPSMYRPQDTENGLMEEYVVRQRELSGHIMLLSTMLKRRKEVLMHGF